MMSEDEEKFKKLVKTFNYKYSDPKKHGFTKRDLDDLREIVYEFDGVPKFIPDTQLLIFLISSNGNKNVAANQIDLFHKSRRDIPEIFSDRDPQNMKIMHSFEHQFFIAIPAPSLKCNVILFGFFDGNPKNYYFFSTAKVFNMVGEANIINNGEVLDTIILIDFEKVRFGHIFRVSVSVCMKAIQYLEQTCPVNIKAVHILNSTSFMGFIINLMRPFTSTGLLNKAHFHKSNMNWNEFYKNHVPKSYLPRDYGGDLESIVELNEKSKKILNDSRDFFIYEQQQANYEFDYLAEYFHKDVH